MRTITFVRHSIRDLSQHEDETASLTTAGHQRAAALVAFFAQQAFDGIFSSPYQRTIDTILPLADARNLPVQIVPAFYERRVGTWVDDFPRFAEQQWIDFDYALAGGESLNAVKERILPAFELLLKTTSGNLLICGHGTALAVLFHVLTAGTFGYPEFQKMTMPDIYEGSFDATNAFLQLTHRVFA